MNKREADLIIAEQDKRTEEILKAIAEVKQDNIKGFTGIEVNGVKFSNIGEMLRYMERQRRRLTKAKNILNNFLNACEDYEISEARAEAEQFLKEE